MPSSRTTRNWKRRVSMATPGVCKPPPHPIGVCPGLDYYLENFLMTSQIQIIQGGGFHALVAETWMHRVTFAQWFGTGPAFYLIDPPPPIIWNIQIQLDYNAIPCYNTWTYIVEDSPPTVVGVGSWDRLQELPSLTPGFFVDGELSIGTPGTIQGQA